MKLIRKPPKSCAACGLEFRHPGIDRLWAMLWDGSCFRMYEYLDEHMIWGPYCTACIGPELDMLNRLPWEKSDANPLTFANGLASMKTSGKDPEGKKVATMSDLKLGDAVAYRDSNGRTKAAFVIATPETIAENTQVEAPAEGHVHLVVFSPTGSRYTSYDIAQGEGPHTFSVL